MNYEQWLACIALWREARGQSLAAMRAIWWVIQNRATDPAKRWPRTIAAVILQPFQFSSFNHDDPNATKFPSPGNPADWQAFLNAQAAVSAPGDDPTSGANSYESEPPDKLPKWADAAKITLTEGPFRFYRL